MTCEFNDKPCGDCNIEYCPDQVEAIQLNYEILKDKVETAKNELHDAEERLSKYLEEYRDVLCVTPEPTNQQEQEGILPCRFCGGLLDENLYCKRCKC
jgi:hypothetical protein